MIKFKKARKMLMGLMVVGQLIVCRSKKIRFIKSSSRRLCKSFARDFKLWFKKDVKIYKP